MIINKAIKLDLQHPGDPKIIHAKQGDVLTRSVTVALYSDGIAWTIPSEVTSIAVAYSKPDGTGGVYDKLPSGANACSSSGSNITATFAPQVLTCSGRVRVDLQLKNSAGDTLHTFGFFVAVEQSAESAITSADYWTAQRKTVLYMSTVPTTADTIKTDGVGSFLPAPAKDDLAIGKNGYLALVTEASGAVIKIKSLGVQWVDFSQEAVLYGSAQELAEAQRAQARENIAAVPTSRKVAGKSLAADILLAAEDVGAIPVPDDPAAKGYVVAVDAIGTDKRPTAWRYVSARPDQQVFFCDEIDIPPNDGESVSLNGLSWYPADALRAGDIVVGRNGYYAEVDDGNSSDEEAVTSVGRPIIDTSAAKSAYAGRVGSATVTNVAAALNALAVGAPLDMSADYASSGAASVAAWATMAKTGDATEYRVAAGRYQINWSGGSAYNVVITNVPNDTARIVQITECNDDPFVYFSVFSATSPGAAPESQVFFSTEERLFDVFGQNVILPSYGAEDKGKVLTVDDSGNPNWKAAAALPTVGTADNGKFLRVVSGAWAAQALTNVAEVGA